MAKSAPTRLYHILRDSPATLKFVGSWRARLFTRCGLEYTQIEYEQRGLELIVYRALERKIAICLKRGHRGPTLFEKTFKPCTLLSTVGKAVRHGLLKASNEKIKDLQQELLETQQWQQQLLKGKR